MLDDVITRLLDFGCTDVSWDTWTLQFLIEKTGNRIKNICNITCIPDELHHVWVDMVVGEFLMNKKATNPDSLSWLDLTAVAKQIKEGDTTIAFAVGEGNYTPEQRLDALIQYLITHGEQELAAHRRLKW